MDLSPIPTIFAKQSIAHSCFMNQLRLIYSNPLSYISPSTVAIWYLGIRAFGNHREIIGNWGRGTPDLKMVFRKLLLHRGTHWYNMAETVKCEPNVFFRRNPEWCCSKPPFRNVNAHPAWINEESLSQSLLKPVAHSYFINQFRWIEKKINTIELNWTVCINVRT